VLRRRVRYKSVYSCCFEQLLLACLSISLNYMVNCDPVLVFFSIIIIIN